MKHTLLTILGLLLIVGCTTRPTPITYTFESAEEFKNQGNFKKAISILSQLVEKKSEISPRAQYLIGDILLNDLLNFEQAISAYKMVIEKFPNSLQAPDALFMVGYIYANILDDTENALKVYNTFLKQYPDHRLSPSVQFEIKWIGADINDIPALKHIDAFSKISPTPDQPKTSAASKKSKSNNTKSTLNYSNQTVIESVIDGDFEGFEGETIIKLMNGQIWQQTEYYYHYHYAFMPKVLIYKSGSGYKMKVDGVDKAVGVIKLK